MLLETSPDDPGANTAAGRYRAFVEDDWAAALPMLAKGADPRLAALAKAELDEPIEPADRLKLANGWLAAAQSDDHFAAECKQEAGKWFRLALPELAGVTRLEVVKKLEGLLGEHGLTAEYFAGSASFDQPLRVGVDPAIDMNYEASLPEEVSSNRFTARWSGWLAAPPKAGQVALVLEHNAGARLWIDGKLVIDAWQEPARMSASPSFPAARRGG